MGDGALRRLGDIAVGDRVIGHSGKPRTVTKVFEQGILPCLKITTHGGREIISALDHPFLTVDGWKEAKDLRPKDVLALSYNHECENQASRTQECRMAGYFIGDGSCGQNGPSLNSSIHAADPEAIESVCSTAADLGFKTVVRHYGKSKCKTIAVNAGCREWLRTTGLAGQVCQTKRVPKFVFQCGKEGIAAFIAGYFECDGTVSKRGSTRTDCLIQFCSVSHDLLKDVRSLLLRLGIQSRIRTRIFRCQTGAECRAYMLDVSTSHDTAKFAEVIPVIGPKARRIAEWSPRRTKFDGPYLPDQVVSIEPHEPTPCRCLTVETDHTFIADDVVVHNTTFAAHRFGLRIAQRPTIRILHGHAK